LRAEGVATVDILPGMWAAGPTSWWKHDSGWSDKGARIAADATADMVGKFMPSGQNTLDVTVVGRRPSPSDLLRRRASIAPTAPARAGWSRWGTKLAVDPKSKAPIRRRPPGRRSGRVRVQNILSARADGLFPQIVGARLGMPVFVERLAGPRPRRTAASRHDALRGSRVSRKVLVWELPEHEPFCVDPDFGAIGEIRPPRSPTPCRSASPRCRSSKARRWSSGTT
jgi:hypothetical protein